MLRYRAIGAAAAVLAATFLATGALAAPNGKALGRSDDGPGKGHGKPAKSERPAKDAVTEDNDRDGVPNAPDPSGDADNRHPSGKDKHVEPGGSGNQGNSASEPDGDGRGPERDEGGLDKPDGTGGLDVLDQDGNNGCGNDDDFEDDNEGLCLGRQGSQARGETDTSPAGDVTEESAGQITEETVPVEDETTPVEIEAAVGAEVLGLVVGAPGAGATPVLGVVAPGAPTDAGELAFTGAEAGHLVAAMLILAVLGVGALMAGRRA